MKRLALLILSLTLAISMLAGCSKKNDTDNSTAPPATEPSDSTNQTDDAAPGDSGVAGVKDSVGGMMLTEGTKLDDIIMRLGEELGIAMPERLDDNTLKDIMGINSEDVEEYYGEYAVVNTSADNIIGVKAKEGRADAVREALEARKDTVIKNFEQYLPDQLDKAKAGKVIQRGDYVFLVIAGDSEKGMDKEIKRAEEIIDSYFQK